MKKLVVFFMFFLTAIFPVLAQDEVQVESLTLKKGNIPPAVIKAADEMFKGSTQIKWGSFPFELKDYGWEVNSDYNEPIDHYEIFMKAADGSDVYAVFESTGELIRYRSINKNAALPSAILKAIEKSEYKDWKIAGDTEKIRDNQKKIVEHYAVKLEKGGQKKTLYYTLDGNLLTNKR